MDEDLKEQNSHVDFCNRNSISGPCNKVFLDEDEERVVKRCQENKINYTFLVDKLGNHHYTFNFKNYSKDALKDCSYFMSLPFIKHRTQKPNLIIRFLSLFNPYYWKRKSKERKIRELWLLLSGLSENSIYPIQEAHSE